MKKTISILVMIALTTGIIMGWAGMGHAAIPERYNINMIYSGIDKAVIPDLLKADGKTRNAAVYIAEFVDMRPVADKKRVGHVREIGDAKVPVFLKNDVPSRIIAHAVKDYLKKAGYNVADKIVQWDLKEGTLPKKGPKVVIGGSLDEMEVSCWTGVFSNDYKAIMKISLVVADAVKGTILHKSQVSVTVTKTDVTYSEALLGNQGDTALADAIGQLFEGKTVAQKLKAALAQ